MRIILSNLFLTYPHKTMNPIYTLPIKELYKVVSRQPVIQVNGLKQYPVIKKYVEDMKDFTQKSLQLKTKPKKKNLRLRTYLDEEEKKHKHIPGPGKYDLITNWHLEQQRNKKVSQRKTFLNEIISSIKRQNSPGPGEHQSIHFSYSKSVSRLNPKKQKSRQRIFFSDQNQYSGSILPGPGQYNVSQRQNTQFRRNNESPEKSMRIFKAMSEKRLKTLPKLPDMASYNPQECSFFTFQTAKRVKPLKKGFGVGERFKTLPEGSNLSPDKYDVTNKWKGKGSRAKTYEKHGLDALSKPQLRVYN